MFQFPRFALLPLCIQGKVPVSASYELPHGNHSKLSGGLPHSEIHGSKVILTSPWLIAEYHVLHRLLLPRHPPNALFALDLIQKKQGLRPFVLRTLLPPRLTTRALPGQKSYFSHPVAGSTTGFWLVYLTWTKLLSAPHDARRSHTREHQQF
jgi:hypothetical protein